MPAPRRDIPAGSVWRQLKLGSEAVYEVIVAGADTVDVRVRVAPGLARGTRLRLSRAAIESMENVDDADERGESASGEAASGEAAS